MSEKKKRVRGSKKEVKVEEPTILIPTGSTLLNLACSDNIKGAYKLGKIITMPGASQGGKSILQLTMFAEMAIRKEFDDFDFYYDDAEEALEFDIPKLFKSIVGRIKAPKYDKCDNSIYSNTIQDFESNILMSIENATKTGKSFVYSLDSLDSLTSSEEIQREFKNAIASAKSDDHAKEIKKSFELEKVRALSKILRMSKQMLKDVNSNLIIVQQERANIGGGFGSTWKPAGGFAPKHYSSHQIITKRIKTHKDKNLHIGSRLQASVKKNRSTGKERIVEFDCFQDYGIDDLGSIVDYLIKEDHWKKKPQSTKYDAKELEIEGTKKELIYLIEENNLENKLRRTVGKKWKEREESVKLNRKNKY